MVWFVDEAIKQNIKTTDVYADAAPKSAVVMRRGISWLKKADRFKVSLPLVPHGAEERFDATLQRFAHGFDLPARFCILEYEHFGTYDVQPDLTRALSTKRIALCVDLDSVHAVYESVISSFERDPDDQGGIMVWALNYFDEKKEWEFAPGAAIIPKKQANDFFLVEANKNIMMRKINRLGEKLFPKKIKTPILVSYIEMLPEICDKLGDEHRQRAIHETNMDAIWAALGYFSSFGCKNVQFDADTRVSMVSQVTTNLLVPIDPFHGYRKNNVSGESVWVQESTFASA